MGEKRTLKREKEKNHFFLNLHSEKENFHFFPKNFYCWVSNFLTKENHFKLETQGFTVYFSFKQKICATFVKCKNQEGHFYGIVLANMDNKPFKVIRSYNMVIFVWGNNKLGTCEKNVFISWKVTFIWMKILNHIVCNLNWIECQFNSSLIQFNSNSSI